MSLRQTTALLHSNQNAPKPSVKNEVHFCGPVSVYRSKAAQLEWFATFDSILKNSVGKFELPSRMLVQLGEQNLQPIDALQASIRTDKEFYAGPLIVCGAPADNIELQLTREQVFLSDGNSLR